MTRDEAIEILSRSRSMKNVPDDIMEAHEMAIKALEQQTCEDCISREAVLENIKGLKKSPWFNDDIPGVRIVRKEAVEIIEDLCIKNLPSVNHAEKQELCEDAVSRQAVLDIFADNADAVRPYSKTWEEVKALPSVNPQPKTGYWIGHREHCENLGVMPSGLGAYEWCSNCDCGIDVREWHINNYNYCPDCGAKMVKPQESEVKE